MSRPLRSEISPLSLVLMGVPKRYTSKTLKDFKDYGTKELAEIKEFCDKYINNIEHNIEDNRGIFFYGSNGVGKSFLSCIILKEAYRHRYSCRRVTFSSYIKAYTESWGASKEDKGVLEQDLLDKYKGVEFLVLEEIGKEIDSKIAKPILEDLLRYREEHGLTTIICSNITPKIIGDTYGASVLSIIKGCMTPIKIVSSDKREEVYKNDEKN